MSVMVEGSGPYVDGRGEANLARTKIAGAARRATAHVADFVRHFGTTSSSAPARAAASETDGVATAWSGAPDGFGTRTAARTCAG